MYEENAVEVNKNIEVEEDPQMEEKLKKRKRKRSVENPSRTQEKSGSNDGTYGLRPRKENQEKGIYLELITDQPERKNKINADKKTDVKKKEWKNNYDGREELGTITNSNIFPPDDFYGSTAEKLFVQINERISYIHKNNIELYVQSMWVPILKNIKEMLEIVVGDISYVNKLHQLHKLYDIVISHLPEPPVISTVQKPPRTVEEVLRNNDYKSESRRKEGDVGSLLFLNL
jgi:hypothetical protein